MSNILTRIQKLLALAGNAGSEAEAALAAGRAAALMAEHEICEAEVRAATPDARAEEIAQAHLACAGGQRKVAWRMRVYSAVARSLGARCYWHRADIRVFGRLSAVQATQYTGLYLCSQIERLCDADAPAGRGGYSRAYRNAWRLGCASRVAERLAALTPQVTRAAAPATTSPVAEDEPAPQPPPSAHALAVVERDRAEVEQAYQRYSKGWGRANIGNVSSGTGYAAGSAAGGRVDLGGGGRGGLPRGQGVLP